ncbi:MAG: heme exporter protein CcmB [Bacteroidota bacterium]|nr:heme exporter protein CcmB [Candidatus Kapabacteria bacterium]MDW8220506.1 heme exporter protein CcmB [Bacteroidota bacterium]
MKTLRAVLSAAVAICFKDVRSELRTRYTLNALALFVMTTVALVAFSSAGEVVSNGIAASMLWIILFFSAMISVQRSFVSEEERGTSLLLSLHAPLLAIYIGKLLFNVLLTLMLYALASAAFFTFVSRIELRSPLLFWVSIMIGGIATASATTIIAAMIAKARAKGALFPVLSFPAVLPLLFVGVETTYQALSGVAFSEARNSLQMLVAYTGSVVAISCMVFDVVWKE